MLVEQAVDRHYFEAVSPLTRTTADPLNEFVAKEKLGHDLRYIFKTIYLNLKSS